MDKTTTELECRRRVLSGTLDTINHNLDTIQKEVEREKHRIRETVKELEKVERMLGERNSRGNMEISDSDAPRCGEKWNALEKEMFLDRLAGFIHDCAVKSGRSTLAIKYKVASYCVKDIPVDKWVSLLVFARAKKE